ncbi:D-beta-hydroxybutyrate dehydrogenase, mitochondrial [Acipenser ruthenus]|uniref:D-beta-hydroxybutyrate dehydrogenase, mitochondrial n=1 Tax=Acipenser ruthenus TaxID=7906 RepID=A0A444U3R4_ACIRT|nr:D-beta-hydroxybutyrate dehydrogenase, mitochondrial [Acipenser ruthenus]
MKSDRMKVVQLNVCSEEEVAEAVKCVRKHLQETETSKGAHISEHSTFHEQAEFTMLSTETGKGAHVSEHSTFHEQAEFTMLSTETGKGAHVSEHTTFHEQAEFTMLSTETGLWALVNNAGVSTFGEVEFTSLETYKQVADVNLWGTIRVTKAFLPLIRRAKGRVVNIASMFGRMSNSSRSPYCVSKYGVEAFSDCLRYEMHRWGVKVSIIEPGNFIAATGILTRDIVMETADKLWKEAPQIVQEDYGRAHFDRHVSVLKSYCNSGLRDVAIVIKDITDAVMSCYPYTRYNPTDAYWWIRLQIMTHLPAAIADRLYIY